MRPRIWLISDTHFSHDNLYTFLNYDGTKVRPQASAVEGDAEIVSKWNALIRSEDKVYHLGDVAMDKKGLRILESLNGTKILIKGNHDKEKIGTYLQYFKDVRSCKVLDHMLLTHYPVHPLSIGKHYCNVHGHTHGNDVPGEGRYINLSVESTCFFPVSLEELQSKVVSLGWNNKFNCKDTRVVL